MKKFAALFLVFTLSLSTVAFASPSMTDNQDGTFTYERTGLVVNSSNEKVAPSAGMSAELTMLSNASAPQGGFTDVTPDSWAKSAIDAMTKAGVLQGYGNGLYGPKDTVSRAQFALMVIRAYGGNVDSLAAKQGNLADIVKSNGDYWANNVICAIQEFGLDANFHYDRDTWDEAATRSEMAHIIMTIAEKMGGEDFKITDGIKNNVGDYNLIAGTAFEDSILKAYSAGILIGQNTNGDYNPAGISNRETAAVVMQRVLDESKREPATVKPEVKPETPPIQEGDNIGALGDVYPKEGDIINGVKVVRDPITGVLGLGNGGKGGIYLGFKANMGDGNFETIQVGSYAPESYDNMNSGDRYVQIGSYVFWTSEWRLIDKQAYSVLPTPSAKYEGQKADIFGNLLGSGNAGEAIYVCKGDAIGMYSWRSID